MGVSLDSGSGRRQGFDLNLVPFIDLLSVNITFLLVTAVWAQTGALPLEQRVGASGAGEPEPPITMWVQPEGVTVLRRESDRVLVPAVSNGFLWDQVDQELARRLTPGERRVNLCMSDRLPYEHMIHALDLTRARGLDEAALCDATEYPVSR